MRHLIFLILLFSLSSSFVQKEKKLRLTNSSQTLLAGQKIQLDNSSFDALYLHVFEYQETGLVKHLNLTGEQKGVVMTIESFELLEENGVSIWLAFLKKENDNKTYVCEIEEAITSKEIKLL